MSLYERYSQELEHVPLIYQKVPAVLFACVLSVIGEVTMCADDAASTDSEIHYKAAKRVSFFDNKGQNIELNAVSTQSSFSGLLNGSLEINDKQNPLIFETEDIQMKEKIFMNSHVLKSSLFYESDPFHITKESLENFEITASVRNQINRLLKDNGLPLKASMNLVERGIKESELLTFTTLSSEDLYRSNQLQEIQNMILQETKALPNFTGDKLSNNSLEMSSVMYRKYLRKISALIFSQILSKEINTEPLIMTKYYEMTDEILYCLHWPPPDRRNKKSKLIYDLSPYVNHESDNSFKLHTENITITPAGKSIVMAKDLRLDNENHSPWMTSYVNNDLIGLRMISSADETCRHSCSFFCHTEEDVRILAFPGPNSNPLLKPDKCGTMCLSHIMPNQLQTVVCSNGDIKVISNSTIISDENLLKNDKYQLGYESYRYISENGKVLRVFNNSSIEISQEILYSDGTRDIYLRPDSLRKNRQELSNEYFEYRLLKVIPENSTMMRLDPLGNVKCYQNSTELPFSYEENLQVITLEDAESKSKVYYYKDGRVLVLYYDGLTTVLFPDGTKFVQQHSTKLLTISRQGLKGWPTVEMDYEVDSTSRKHAKGLEIPINKGGDRVRSRVILADGSIVFIKYDTRVTAKTNGTLRLIRRDKTCIVLKDDAQLIYHPASAWSSENAEIFRKDSLVEEQTSNELPIPPKSAQTFKPPSTDQHAESMVMANVISTPNNALTGKINKHTRFKTPSTAESLTLTQKTLKRSSKLPDSKETSRLLSQIQEKLPEVSIPEANIQGYYNDEPDAIFTINLLDSTCLIRDYEFNEFFLNFSESTLNSDLHQDKQENIDETKDNNIEKQEIIIDNSESLEEKTLTSRLKFQAKLAGEVEGLKPPAVAESPKPPRIFIVNRKGEALELLSHQSISLFQSQVLINPDVFKIQGGSIQFPTNRNPSALIQYFIRRKSTSSLNSGYNITEILGPRYYSQRKFPSAAIYVLRKYPNINFKDESPSDINRLFECLSILQKEPLSYEEYQNINLAIKRCEEFRQQRLQSLDRFAVDDPRTPEQIADDENILKRLKQSYKVAKMNAAKRKEQRARERKEESSEEHESQQTSKDSKDLESQTKKDYKLNKVNNSTILEGDEDDDEADENDHFGSDDEDNVEITPEESMIRTTFEDFSCPSRLEGWSGDVIPLSCLQEAFVRMFNRFITNEMIEHAIFDTDEVEPTMDEFTLGEFKAIYKSMIYVLNPEIKPSKDSIIDSLSTDSFEGSVLSEPSEPPSAMESRATSPYQAELGMGSLVKPLNFSNLEYKSLDGENKSKDPADDSLSSYPAGSAIQVIRKTKSTNRS